MLQLGKGSRKESAEEQGREGEVPLAPETMHLCPSVSCEYINLLPLLTTFGWVQGEDSLLLPTCCSSFSSLPPPPPARRGRTPHSSSPPASRPPPPYTGRVSFPPKDTYVFIRNLQPAEGTFHLKEKELSFSLASARECKRASVRPSVLPYVHNVSAAAAASAAGLLCVRGGIFSEERLFIPPITRHHPRKGFILSQCRTQWTRRHS